MTGIPHPGLCGRCGHAQRVVSGKGSVFVMCGLSRDDPRYPKYPPLPVPQCAGFEPERHADDGLDA